MDNLCTKLVVTVKSLAGECNSSGHQLAGPVGSAREDRMAWAVLGADWMPGPD